MKFLKVLFLLSLIAISLTVVLLSDDREIFLLSQESKTNDGGSVFNKIKWFSSSEKDIWMMNQSHFGTQASPENWDRLAIVVDKTKTPKTVQFYQLEPGSLEWKEGLKEVTRKAICMACHSNGPRAIRPQEASWKDQLKASLWNLRIKTYGRIILDPLQSEQSADTKVPLRLSGQYENQALTVATCLKCHQEKGFFARGPLLRQNRHTIRFMVESGAMPPPGFRLSKTERSEIEKFIHGF